jgi:hypothetical protein
MLKLIWEEELGWSGWIKLQSLDNMNLITNQIVMKIELILLSLTLVEDVAGLEIMKEIVIPTTQLLVSVFGEVVFKNSVLEH